MVNRRRKAPEKAGVVSVDIGGTFTDFVAISPQGGLETLKLRSTPPDYDLAVMEGLRTLVAAWSSRDCHAVLHGTTVATNAVLEGRGARLALVTTRGFRDVLEVGRGKRPDPFDSDWRPPQPLVPRRLRFEVSERVLASGSVLIPVDESELDRVAEELVANEIEAVAVALVNSYANPQHESLVLSSLAARVPHLFVTASSDLDGQIGEFERFSTACVNAYLQPLMDRYLNRLTESMSEIVDAPMYVMQSNGGLGTTEDVRREPVRTVESGPAAGVLGAAALCRAIGLDSAITFDMGGTTAKAALIEDGRPREASEYAVGGTMSRSGVLSEPGGYVIRAPSIDLSEVGTGGGSIARVDAGGALAVGPQSAGAMPGPACYGLGGQAPTVTDAYVVLGLMGAGRIAGGQQSIDAEAARKALRPIAEQLGMSLEEAASTIYSVATSSMLRAIRAVTVERGRDPREFDLIAFGGAGPLHAANLADLLEIRRVIVPPAAGIFSAAGLLFADLRHDAVRTVQMPISGADGLVDPGAVMRAIEKAGDALGDDIAVGGHGEDGESEWLLDLRYRGQLDLVSVLLGRGELPRAEDALAATIQEFETEYARVYGHTPYGQTIEVVNVRRRTWRRRRAKADYRALSGRPPAAPPRRRSVTRRNQDMDDVAILTRGDVAGAGPRAGPLIIEEPDCTCFVPRDWTAAVDEFGNVVITRT